MTTPLVSVVMSVFNGKRFLAEAVESILDQEFRDFEFIIIDDGSGDGSASELDSYQRRDSRVRVCHQEHAGLVKSLNKGCGLARGRYIARMDADDVALRDRLALQVEFLKTHPEIGVVGASVEWINAAGKSLYISRNPAQDCEIKADLLLHRRCALWHPTILLHKDVFTQAGGYRSNFVGAEDYDLWLRIAEKSQLANLGPVVLRYRIHSSQVSIQQRMQQTRSTLGAQLAAKRRSEGRLDPLNDSKEITSETLVALGISAGEQNREIFQDYRKWIRIMCNAGEYASALKAAREVQGAGIKDVERWELADLHLTVAKLLWEQREFVGSAISAVHAFFVRPFVIGRPVKRLLIGSS